MSCKAFSRGPYNCTDTICPQVVGSIDLEHRQHTMEWSVCRPLVMDVRDGRDPAVEGPCTLPRQSTVPRF